MTFTIYCHTNNATQKRYVGLTKHSVERRWRQHVRDSARNTQWLFHRAIRLYGPGGFTSEVLEVVDTLEAANEAERWWIAHFGSNDNAVGYNLDAGGTARNTHDSTRHKLSENASRQMAARSDEEKERFAREHSDFMKARAASMSDAERDALIACTRTIEARANQRASLKEMWSRVPKAERATRMANVVSHRTAEDYCAAGKKAAASMTREQRSARASIGWATRRAKMDQAKCG